MITVNTQKPDDVLLLFFGPDGSGKTTLAKASAERLREKGFKVKVSWMRGTHTFASFIAAFLSKFAVFEGTANPYYNISIPPKLKRVWQTIEFVSALPIVLFRYTIPSVFGFYVVGERCPIDFIVWVAFTTEDESYINGFASRVLQSLTLKKSKAVYITADLNTLLTRRKDITPSKLSIQQHLYRKISASVNAYTLNTTEGNPRLSLEKLTVMIQL
ncbi:MAG: AAA family ATPase [Candidatus Bathyarchaeota archaeon]|nr:AAA family ATPase [Candidatus Bathyarchaeota archaeon]